NNKEASSHQDVTQEENYLNADEKDAEHPEGEVIDAGRPKFAVGGQSGHHLSSSLADECRNGNDLVAARANAVDDQGQCFDRLRALPASVVKKDDVAFIEIFEDIFRDVFRAVTRRQRPVAGIDFVANCDVAHILRELERLHLVGGVGLLVDRVWRAEEDRLYAELRAEQALGNIDLL